MTKSSVRKKGSDKPTIKEIHNNDIRDGVAPEWYDLGVALLPDHLQGELDIISKNKSADAKACCTEMFKKWLQVDTTASWTKLIEALRKIKEYQLAETIRKNVLQEEPSSENGERREKTEVNNQQSPLKRRVNTHDPPSLTVPVGKQQEPSSENGERREETEVNKQQSPLTRKVNTHNPPSLTVPVGKQHNNNGTNSSEQKKKVDRSTTWIKLTIVFAVSVVILAIYIRQGPHNSNGLDTSPQEQKSGLQQKQEDVSSVQESTYQTEGTSNVPKPTNRGSSKEYKVFREYSDELANILPVNNIINKLISAKIITFDDSEEIKGLSKSQDKASFVLNMVAKSLKAGITDDFYSLLRIMEEYEGTVAKIANKIREGLK